MVGRRERKTEKRDSRKKAQDTQKERKQVSRRGAKAQRKKKQNTEKSIEGRGKRKEERDSGQWSVVRKGNKRRKVKLTADERR